MSEAVEGDTGGDYSSAEGDEACGFAGGGDVGGDVKGEEDTSFGGGVFLQVLFHGASVLAFM